MYDRNPHQVQFLSHTEQRRRTPLVLIHDGGGTTFSYFILGNLHRDVWAIHNPKFFTAELWEGGMDEMARHYISLLQKAGISGTIFLGGWSLGGLLSLAISRKLADDKSFGISVAGLILVDSPYHIPWSKLPSPTSDPVFHGIPELVRKSFDNCDALLDYWELPTWDGPLYEGKSVGFKVGGKAFTVPAGQVLYKPLREEWRTMEIGGFQHKHIPPEPISPPPAVMMQCIGRAPTKNMSKDPCRVDIFREEPLLGWDGRYPDFIKAVIVADAHHFNIFEFSKISEVTAQLNEGLEILDSLETSTV